MILREQQKINELLTRGVEHVYPSKEFLEKELKSGRQLTLYTGYDPTAPTLHIGHGITMLKLRQFQELGHKVIMLIGDFTGMIGDPTDKSSARQKLTREQVLVNCKNYQKQATAILDFDGDNPAVIKYNSDWLGKMYFADVLELTALVTVQRMVERDMFQKRLADGKPIYVHEFLYPLMQGYDSVAMDVDGEVGGNDQTFNMLVGRDLMKSLKKKEKFVLTVKLLADDSGKKMGKTEGNMIALNDSPEDMFGKVMRWTDGMIRAGFELCARVEIPDEKEIRDEPLKYKKLLAYEITKTFLGEDAAKEGQEHFALVIQDKAKPADMPVLKPSAYDIVTVLVESKMCSSKAEARRAIEQGGVRVNDVVIDVGAIPSTSAGRHELPLQPGDVVQKGKRFFVRLV